MTAGAFPVSVPRLTWPARQHHDTVILLRQIPDAPTDSFYFFYSLMSWMAWVAVLVAWPLISLGVAYLFGRFIGGREAPDNASDLIPRQ
jgi:hypothetical protein